MVLSKRVGIVIAVKLDLLRHNIPDRVRSILRTVVGTGDRWYTVSV